MVKLCMDRTGAGTNRELIFLPNFTNYTASMGDVGMLCRIVNHQGFADGRANIAMHLQAHVVVLAHWIEAGSRGLHWCKFRFLSAQASNPHVATLSRAGAALPRQQDLETPP